MNGEVRFAWVDTMKEELLASSFSVKELPATYLIKDGIAYHYRDFQYSENIQKYIKEEGYLKSTYSFKQPGRIFVPQLYLYTYPVKELRRWYRSNLEMKVNQFIREHKLEITIKPLRGAEIIYKILLGFVLLILYTVVRLIASCFKEKKPKEEAVMSSSMDDVRGLTKKNQ